MTDEKTVTKEEKQTKGYSVPNVLRCLSIIEFMAKYNKSYSVTELAETLNLTKNSVFRIVKTLASEGYLDSIGKSYKLSTKLLTLGYSSLSDVNLIDKSIATMRKLRDAVQETVFIGVLNGSKGVVLESVTSLHPIKFTVDIGHVFSLSTSAPGKAILAFLPEIERDRILDDMTFEYFTETTITTKADFLDELSITRKKGYGIDNGEKVNELKCIGAPIFNHWGYPIASIWVTGPSFRLREDDLNKFGNIVAEHALEISREIGYNTEKDDTEKPS